MRIMVFNLGDLKFKSDINSVEVRFLFAFFLLGLFSPLLGWLSVLLALTFFDSSNYFRKLLGLQVVFFSSVIASSRAIGETPSDDFAFYYLPAFNWIASGDVSRIFSFGDGLEVGFGILLYFFSYIVGVGQESFLIFLIVFFSLFLLWFFVEKYAIKYVDKDFSGLMVAGVLGLTYFIVATQVMRQFSASIFVMFAFLSGSRLISLVWLVLAVMFHQTSLFIYIFLKGAIKSPLITVLFIIVGVLFVKMNMTSIVSSFLDPSNPVIGASKIGYYEDKLDGSELTWMSLMGFVKLALIFGLLFFKNNLEDVVVWRKAVFVFCVLYLLLLSFPLASYRFTLFFTSVFFGYFIIIGTHGLKRGIVKLFLSAYFVFWCVRSVLPNDEDPFRFWVGFDAFGIVPGYYLLNYFGLD